MDTNLKERYVIVKEWLTFAETKHAAFIALNGAALFGLIEYFKGNSNADLFFKVISVLLILTSVVSSIISFIPILNKATHTKSYTDAEFSNKKISLNSFYFQDIATLTAGQYLELCEIEQQNPTNAKVNIDLADQIIQNSKIAISKFRFFSLSAWLTLCALVFFTVNLIISFF